MAGDLVFYLLRWLPTLAIAAPILIWLLSQRSSPQIWRWILIVFGIGSLALFLTVVITKTWVCPRDRWCLTRFAPTMALHCGTPLYPPPGEGPALVRMYGPVAYLFYLPATLAKDPLIAIRIAAYINVVFLASAVAVFLCMALREVALEYKLAAAGLGSLVACMNYDVLAQWVMISIDGPACAFLLFSAACCTSDRLRGAQRGLLIGLLLGLSVWSKQTMLPGALVLLGWEWILRRHRSTVIAAAMLLGFSALMLIGFGPRNLLFHLLVIPSHQPPRLATWSAGIWEGTRILALDLREIWTLFIAAFLLTFVIKRHAKGRPNSGATITLLLAFAILPTALIAYAKVLGGTNNFAAPSLLLILSAVIRLGMLLDNSSPVLGIAQRVFRAMLICLGVSWCWLHREIPQRSLHDALESRTATYEVEQGYQICRQNPNRFLLPRMPLASMFATGHVASAEDAADDLKLAQMPLTREQLVKSLPPKMEAIVFSAAAPSAELTALLPEYCVKSVLPGFAGWWQLRKP